MLKLMANREALLYGVAGILTTLIGFAVYWGALQLGFGVVLSNSMSHIAAIVFAFFSNKVWVFKSQSFTGSVILKESLKFIFSRLIAYAIDTLLLVLLVYALRQNPLASRLATIILVVVFNFVVSKYVVFSKKKNAACEET